jgi:hypothetical protein
VNAIVNKTPEIQALATVLGKDIRDRYELSDQLAAALLMAATYIIRDVRAFEEMGTTSGRPA